MWEFLLKGLVQHNLEGRIFNLEYFVRESSRVGSLILNFSLNPLKSNKGVLEYTESQNIIPMFCNLPIT